METAVSVTLRGNPASVAEARRFVRDVVAGRGVSEACSEVVTLLVSELVTNAVVHAGGDVGLSIEVTHDAVRLGVRDGDSRIPAPVVPRPEGGGFGLWLLDHLAGDWFVEEDAGGAGKTVWFSVSRSGERAPDSWSGT